jgi:hypothetical protein
VLLQIVAIKTAPADQGKREPRRGIPWGATARRHVSHACRISLLRVSAAKAKHASPFDDAISGLFAKRVG